MKPVRTTPDTQPKEATVTATDTPEKPALHLVPVSFADACAFITAWHRHHEPPVGGKFWVGVATTDQVLHGVAVVGRPVARHFDDGTTLEVTRVAVDDTADARHACSKLYAACWNAAKSLGYSRLITYTQEGESGASLRGAGWRIVAERRAHAGWNRPSRPREDRGTDGVQRFLWEAA